MTGLFVWNEHQHKHDDGTVCRCDYLIDGSGRVLAIIEHPTPTGFAYECALGVGDAERIYIDIDQAKKWCEEAASRLLEDEEKRAICREEWLSHAHDDDDDDYDEEGEVAHEPRDHHRPV